MKLPLHILSLAFLLSTVSHGQKAPKWPDLKSAADTEPLPGTRKLSMEGNLSRQLVDANDRFLDERIAAAAESRQSLWEPDPASAETYEAAVSPYRATL
ncbi:MAG: hypothetical protein KDL87_19475, partial [Verrucomicrobiae bacterium]|nr:hypothetical protein [Verrucomicrobiae bacterium]